jgi:hypothetical protein
MDRKLLEAVVHRFDGGPVGLDNIAASIGEESGTIEDVIEPYLIQQGFLQRTPRGRMATQAAYRHLGLPVPGDDASASQAWAHSSVPAFQKAWSTPGRASMAAITLSSSSESTEVA